MKNTVKNTTRNAVTKVNAKKQISEKERLNEEMTKTLLIELQMMNLQADMLKNDMDIFGEITK